MKTILVGYDGNEAADRALDRAIAEARASHGRLVVLAVLELTLDPDTPRNFGTLDDGPDPVIPTAVPPALEPVLSAARERVTRAAVPARLAWAAGEPAQELVEAARAARADTIVVGHHHHGFLSRVFGTDVAAELKRTAGCEVIVAE
jgi:nucleotide-binding universal stress UspA family protein